MILFVIIIIIIIKLRNFKTVILDSSEIILEHSCASGW